MPLTATTIQQETQTQIVIQQAHFSRSHGRHILFHIGKGLILLKTIFVWKLISHCLGLGDQQQWLIDTEFLLGETKMS